MSDLELSEIGMKRYLHEDHEGRSNTYFEWKGRALSIATEERVPCRILGPNGEVLDTVQPLPPSHGNPAP